MSRRECGYESCFDIANIRRPAGQQRLIYDSDSRHYSALLKADSMLKQGPQGTTALYYIVSHCIALYYIVMHCFHYITLYCNCLHCITLYYTVLYFITLNCTLIHYIALNFLVLHHLREAVIYVLAEFVR